MDPTRIAVIGTGSVGAAVATCVQRIGHHVVVGTRSPDGEAAAALQAGGIEVASPVEAKAGAEIVVLAVPAPALADVVPSLGLAPGQIVVDATNAVGTPLPEGFDTLGDYVASLAPQTSIVKAFNTVGAEFLDGTSPTGDPVFLPIAGDEAGRQLVVDLVTEMGFDVADLGGREHFRLMEDHARLWIHLAFGVGWGRDFAFTVARQPG